MQPLPKIAIITDHSHERRQYGADLSSFAQAMYLNTCLLHCDSSVERNGLIEQPLQEFNLVILCLHGDKDALLCESIECDDTTGKKDRQTVKVAPSDLATVFPNGLQAVLNIACYSGTEQFGQAFTLGVCRQYIASPRLTDLFDTKLFVHSLLHHTFAGKRVADVPYDLIAGFAVARNSAEGKNGSQHFRLYANGQQVDPAGAAARRH